MSDVIQVGLPETAMSSEEALARAKQVERVRLRRSDEPSCSSRHRAVGVACLVDAVTFPVEVELPVALEVAIRS